MQVPLGSRTVTGCVVGPADAVRPTTIKDVVAVLDDEPFLPPAIVDLALWMGEYYAAGPGDTLVNAMPPAARRAEAAPFRMRRIVELAPGATAGTRRARRASAAGAASSLATRPGGVPLTELAQAGVSAATVRRLARDRRGAGARRGRRARSVRWRIRPRQPLESSSVGAAAALSSPSEQVAALDRLRQRSDERAVPRGPAPRRDRQRQDGGVPAPGGARGATGAAACSCSCRRSR